LASEENLHRPGIASDEERFAHALAVGDRGSEVHRQASAMLKVVRESDMSYHRAQIASDKGSVGSHLKSNLRHAFLKPYQWSSLYNEDQLAACGK
jgi:hypothetical protein